MPFSKPAFLSELAVLGSKLYENTTPEQRAQFIGGIVDLLEGSPTKLELFAKLEGETIAIKAAGK
jgi:hypothetical protein